MIARFFLPYGCFLSRAAYAIQQSLTNLGIRLTPPDHLPGIAVTPDLYLVMGLLTLCAVCEAWLFMFAVLALRRPVVLCFGAGFLLMPGLLALSGVAGPVNPQPAEIVLGNGAIDIPGYATLAVMAFAGGWSLTVLAADVLKLTQKSFDLFKHVWIAMGLSAGLFFIASVSAESIRADYQETQNTVRQSSGWLMQQLVHYSDWCEKEGRMHQASCVWASRTHEVLLEQSQSDLRYFVTFSPETLAGYYGSFRRDATPDTEAAIRREIGEYNTRLCPVVALGGDMQQYTISEKCEAPPAGFCGYAFKYGGTDDPDRLLRPVAVATECVFPTLLTLRDHAASIQRSTSSNEFKMAFYLAVAFLSGIKLAGSTFKSLSIDKTKAPDAGWLFLAICRSATCLRGKTPLAGRDIVMLIFCILPFIFTVFFLFKPLVFLGLPPLPH
ncbi:hypothetical protein [Acetobacter conturbans]|uniref:Uncharacterized protein n=1 Tax=Acetobacter conturbans TaxID=1737472 RepID=A0ABX0JWC6_9PROT|nr:hypothetical protein [Acetobacter conturbans]NHN87162.1 hypothetical protein [Acetobacter conturbans]